MGFTCGFEKISGKYDELKRAIGSATNPISRFLTGRKLDDLKVRAMRTAFKNPSKASALMDRADAYSKAKQLVGAK